MSDGLAQSVFMALDVHNSPTFFAVNGTTSDNRKITSPTSSLLLSPTQPHSTLPISEPELYSPTTPRRDICDDPTHRQVARKCMYLDRHNVRQKVAS
jgi:hypothetical protein